jgi:hypothetical protein
MDFERIIGGIEKLLYRIIIEMIMLPITIKRLFRNTKNCYTIVEREENIPQEEARYLNITSPVKLAIIIAIISLYALQQMNTIDETLGEATTTAVTDSTETATDSATIAADSTLVDTSAVTDAEQVIENEAERADYLIESITASLSKLNLVEQSLLIFLVANFDAILLALLLGRMKKQTFPGDVFRRSFFSMIYAKSYTSIPVLLMMLCAIFIPTAANNTDEMPLLTSEILLFIGLLLYLWGIYLFMRATYYILQQYIGEKKWWFKSFLLICLFLLGYGWIVFMI